MTPTIEQLVCGDAALRACGVDIAAGWGSRAFAYAHPGTLPIARATTGTVYNLYCALKPLACWGYRDTPLAAIISAHKTIVPNDVDAFSFLNADDATRERMRHRIVHAPFEPTSQTAYHEVATLMLLEHATGRTVEEAVRRTCAEAGLERTFARSAEPDLPSVACLIDYVRRGASLPLLQDRLPDFYDSEFLKYIGGYSTTADLLRFLRHVVLDGTVSGDEAGSYDTGFMVGMHNWDIDVADVWSIGHIGFLRTALLYAEPETGFVFAGVQRAVRREGYDQLPALWSELVCAARSALAESEAPGR